jgi:hypothetical protein
MSEAAAWWGIGASLLSALVTGFIVHYLTKDRDAETRKSILDREADVRRRQFRRHILKASYTLERMSHETPNDALWKVYCGMAPEILSEAELVVGDFPSDFKKLVKRAGEWRWEDAQAAATNGKTLRDILRDSIRDVYEFANREVPDK